MKKNKYIAVDSQINNSRWWNLLLTLKWNCYVLKYVEPLLHVTITTPHEITVNT